MKTILIAFSLTFILTACGHDPIKTSFPDLPVNLMKAPDELKTLDLPNAPSVIRTSVDLPSKVTLSTVEKSITDNYKTCNLYKEQIFGLQEWLVNQKKLNP